MHEPEVAVQSGRLQSSSRGVSARSVACPTPRCLFLLRRTQYPNLRGSVPERRERLLALLDRPSPEYLPLELDLRPVREPQAAIAGFGT